MHTHACTSGLKYPWDNKYVCRTKFSISKHCSNCSCAEALAGAITPGSMFIFRLYRKHHLLIFIYQQQPTRKWPFSCCFMPVPQDLTPPCLVFPVSFLSCLCAAFPFSVCFPFLPCCLLILPFHCFPSLHISSMPLLASCLLSSSPFAPLAASYEGLDQLPSLAADGGAGIRPSGRSM